MKEKGVTEMDLFDVIEKRHSYRGNFKEEKIPKSDLIKITEAGLKAPSGKNLQTTEFIIVDDDELLDSLKRIFPVRGYILSCQAMILCLIDKQPEIVLENSHFQIEDCAAAVENMLLAITALGYASVWLDGILRREKLSEKISAIIGIPENKSVRILLPVGIPSDEIPEVEKLNFEKRAWFNRYGKSEV